jgi:hypothetical protein
MYHYPNGLDLTHTWGYTSHFEDQNIEYAEIWARGKSLDETCPEHLREEWLLMQQTARAFLNSFYEAKVNLDDVCFYDLVPKKFLLKYCAIKNKVTEHVFENYKKPLNYDFTLELYKFIDEISKQRLNICLNDLNFSDTHVRKIYDKVRKASKYIKYNPWGTSTGRLTVDKDSFPILTLNKELRSAIKPKNDLFIELDFNAAEIRTLLGLAGEEQQDRDIHEWLSKHVFDSKYDREQTKKKVFAWLYNPDAKNKKLSQYIDKKTILKKYYFDGVVKTPYNRSMEVDDKKALNYLVQSTSSDLFLRSALNVRKVLKETNSKIAFCIHDSLVIDFCKEDKQLLQSLIELFASNQFGKFKVNLSMGKNFGAMRKIK